MGYDLDDDLGEWKAIKQVDAMGIAQLYAGVAGAFIGVFGLLYVLVGVFGGLVTMTNDIASGLGVIVMTLVAYVVIVAMYVAMTFVMGLILGAVLNVVLGRIGGVRVLIG